MTPAAGYVRFPPGRGQLLLPLSSPAAFRATLAMYPACRPAAAWAQGAAWLLGPERWPGRAEAPDAPLVPEEVWTELREVLRHEVGAWDEQGLYVRPQADRPGGALLLLRAGAPLAFVKVAPALCGTLAREAAALEGAAALRPLHFRASRPLAHGCVRDWAYLAVEPLPPRMHRVPRRPPLAAVLTEVRAALRHLPSPPSAPAHWVPLHGDFAPWNLRDVPGWGRALFDWEGAGWGPPGADLLWYRLTERAVRGGPGRIPEHEAPPEAVLYWSRELRRRTAEGGRERGLRATLLGLLERLDAGLHAPPREAVHA